MPLDWDTVLPKTPEAYEAFADRMEAENDHADLAWFWRSQATKLRGRKPSTQLDAGPLFAAAE